MVSKERFNYGGQAVIEGVMMRGRTSMAVAVRHPDGSVVVHAEPLDKGLYRSPWAQRPLVRGVVMLWDALALGMRALAYSATVAAGDESRVQSPESRVQSPESNVPSPTSRVEDAQAETLDSGLGTLDSTAEAQGEAAAKDAFGGALMWGTLVAALIFGIGIFFVSPLLVTRLVDSFLPSAALSVLFEGLVRIAMFFGYIWLIGRFPDVRRVFAYHGAEHKAINALEAGEPMQAGRVLGYSVAHPRCGTSFLLFVVLLSVVVFVFFGRPPLPIRLASRVVLVPVIAALAYELIRFAARHATHPAVRLLLAPGLALQSLTTREPNEAQVEVAIAALERVLDADRTAPGPTVEAADEALVAVT